MEIKQLVAFKTLMETGLVSVTAKQMHITQPAVSKIIKSLEEDVGVPLFKREKMRLVPTAEAHYLLSVATEILDKVNESKRFLKDYGGIVGGDLNILSIPGPTLFLIPHIISSFLKNNEHVRSSLVAITTPQVINWISNHQKGIGIAEWFEASPSLKMKKVSLPCVCAVPKKHALSSLSRITPKDLDGVPMVLINEEHAIHRNIKRIFDENKCRLNVCATTDIYISSFSLVEELNMINIVDPISVYGYKRFLKNDDIVFIPFYPNVYLDLSVISAANSPLSGAEFLFKKMLIEKLESFCPLGPHREENTRD